MTQSIFLTIFILNFMPKCTFNFQVQKTKKFSSQNELKGQYLYAQKLNRNHLLRKKRHIMVVTDSFWR